MKCVSFGEVLLRLSTMGYFRLFQEKTLNTTFCGAEINVAVSVANYGMDSCFVSILPEGTLGDAVIHDARAFGVDMSKCLRQKGRLGLYYHEKGASQRPSKVIYDRKSSTFSKIQLKEIDWESILEAGDWLHFSGINPALGDNVAAVCVEACKAAKRIGVTISCDLNYRAKLWSVEKAQSVMKEIVPYVDVCIGNEEDIEKVLGIQLKKSDISKGELDVEEYSKVACEISKLYKCKYIAVSLRESINADVNNWSGILYNSDQNRLYCSKKYTINLVDRVGGGDSFSGALIYSLASGYTDQEAVEFASAASCLKQTLEGDFNRMTKDEVIALVKGNSSGRIQR